jgi:hypothetical protein
VANESCEHEGNQPDEALKHLSSDLKNSIQSIAENGQSANEDPDTLVDLVTKIFVVRFKT